MIGRLSNGTAVVLGVCVAVRLAAWIIEPLMPLIAVLLLFTIAISVGTAISSRY